MEKIDNYNLKLAQALLLVLPIAVFFGKAATDIGASLIAVCYLAHVIMTKDISPIKHAWVKSALILWGYLVIHSLFAPDISLALKKAAPFIRYPLFAIGIAFWVITSKEFSKYLLISLGVGLFMLSADAVLQFITGTDIMGKEKFSEDRLTGPFRRPRIGYTITWMAFPLIVACLHYRGKIIPYLGQIFLSSLVIAAVILSGERSPTLLLLLGIGLTCLLLPAIRKRLLWLIPTGVIAIAGLLALNPTLYERQVVSTMDTIGNIWESPYGKIALDATEVIKSAPVFGIGLNHYRTLSNDPAQGFREMQNHPHNFYLEIWAETGIVGLLLLFGFFGSLLIIFWQSRSLWLGDFLATGLIISILIRMWPIIMNPSFYSSWNVVPLWLCIGWLIALLNFKQKHIM